MKGRFSSADLAVIVQELKRFLGMRVVNVYDIDNKTYLIRIGKPDEKTVILLESGIRLHSTEFDWPKNPAPSGFSMKLRKHLKGRRLEGISQLGIDRIVDLQFGSGEAAYHVILELYDRGNMVLTDYEFNILTLLRPRTDATQDVRFAVREKYPLESGKIHQPPTRDRILELMKGGKDGDVLKKFLVPHLDYGSALIDHVLLGAGFSENVKFGKAFDINTDIDRLMTAIEEAETLLTKFQTEPCKGYIIQKKDKKPNPAPGEDEDILLYEEFHPFLFHQHSKMSYAEFDKYDQAVDEFFSKLESQKLDVKVIQQEKTALKKLEHVKKDNEKRIQGLQKEQETDILRGQLIEMNLDLVDQAILIVRSAIANQIDWTEIWHLVKEAQVSGDKVANSIKALKLDSNQITLLLHDPYVVPEDEQEDGPVPLKPMRVDIDLGMSAYGNSRKYFDMKRQAAKKEQKTVEASNKAFKSAEKKTKQTLKDVATAATINKTRKTYWFEKFLWFISSENYIIIGGHDSQQNELLVKRYLKPGDLYVHADLHGASSCILKNPGGNPVPPKTLNEAGTMAICNSAAWDSKVVTSAWWVYHDQVSKTAPSGEYLTTGSFMIRGKKNYLPPSYLIYGFGFLFKLEEGSVERHKGERRIRVADDDAMSVTDSAMSSVPEDDDLDIDISDDSASDEENETLRKPGTGNEGVDIGNEGGDDEIDDRSMDTKSSSHGQSEGEKKADGSGNSAKPRARAEVELGIEFPDTNISLTHVKGDKYELQRELSTASTTNNTPDTFYLGDDMPVTLGEKISSKSGKISAKQRREMKKKKAQGVGKSSSDDEEEKQVSWLHAEKPENQKNNKDNDDQEDESDDDSKIKVTGASSNPVLPPKRGQRGKMKKMKEKYADQDEEERKLRMEILARGQRGKMKKMKEKYADQDEEERKLRMEILASAGPQKEEKKKGKKRKDHPPPKTQQPPQSQKPTIGRGQDQGKEKLHNSNKGQDLEVTVEIRKLDTVADESETKKSEPTLKQEADSDGEKEEELAIGEDEAILNSLTGQPVPEDELLFAIPVCAPYSSLLNYKYKVKLMPGSTKKGKAVKTALNMFVHEKSTSSREKDLLKVQKDVDLARNVPGKVKVAAPNLHKNKR